MNQREFTRNKIRHQVLVRPENGEEIRAWCSQISMNGVLVESDVEVPMNTHCHITLTLGDGTSTIDIEARVVSHRNNRFGMAFLEMSPEDFQHLRNLNLYNADHPEQVESELDHHLGFKTRIE
ncbi:MAG: PilZ domain-containing protein [Leptospirillia bacterium]